jgi:hypothetical protein
MNTKQIAELLDIAERANKWPALWHLRDAALKELESAYLSTVETIQPVMVVDGKETRHGERSKGL